MGNEGREVKYIKRPIIIEAFRFGYEKIPDWLTEENYILHDHNNFLSIPTLEGMMLADKGDYIIKGINGEFYPCKPDIFVQTYSEVVE